MASRFFLGYGKRGAGWFWINKVVWACISELPKKLTLNKLALIGEAEKSP